MNKDQLKEENCESIEEYFDRIIDLKRDGQNRESKEYISRMKPRQKKDFVHYCHDLYFEKQEDIEWCHNQTLELL